MGRDNHKGKSARSRYTSNSEKYTTDNRYKKEKNEVLKNQNKTK
jgi:hypothetical protein